MANLEEEAVEAQQQWTNYTFDKRIAQMEFEEHWRDEKQRRRDRLDETLRALFAQNYSVPDITRLTGNTNNNYLYGLRTEMKSVTHTEDFAGVSEDDLGIEFDWQYHNHIGVHGWLVSEISETPEYAKTYAQPGTKYEGEYAIFKLNYEEGFEAEFVAGSKNFAQSLTSKEIERRVTMLTQLLTGVYSKAIRQAKNPFTK